MSPPGLTATPVERRNTCAVPRESMTAEVLARETGKLLEKIAVDRSRQWINRTARAYLRSPMNGIAYGTYLMARLELNAEQRAKLETDPELRYRLSYWDPTGEQAASNVDREHGRRR